MKTSLSTLLTTCVLLTNLPAVEAQGFPLFPGAYAPYQAPVNYGRPAMAYPAGQPMGVPYGSPVYSTVRPASQGFVPTNYQNCPNGVCSQYPTFGTSQSVGFPQLGTCVNGNCAPGNCVNGTCTNGTCVNGNCPLPQRPALTPYQSQPGSFQYNSQVQRPVQNPVLNLTSNDESPYYSATSSQVQQVNYLPQQSLPQYNDRFQAPQAPLQYNLPAYPQGTAGLSFH